MGKILQFNNDTDNTIQFLENITKQVQEENIDNMLVISKLNNGEVLIGATKNLDWGTKLELVGHLQVDIIDNMIKTNYVTP